jgi:glycosyltransferase involved in cell wall biosynthesis
VRHDPKLLLVHHFALSRVTGVMVMVAGLLGEISRVQPATCVEYVGYEDHTGPDGFEAALSARHSDTDCVVAVNAHIDVAWEYTLRLLEWCRQTGTPLCLYVHDYWPQHRAPVELMVARFGARLLASTDYVRQLVERDGFHAILAPVGVSLSNVSVPTHDEIGAARSLHRPATVASVGRLVRRKRFMDVVQAISDVHVDRPLRLVLRLLPSCVNAPRDDEWHLRQLRTVIDRAGLAGSVRIERTPTSQIDYARYDAYVCASAYEGLSMTPIEAAYSGCPPLMSDIPAHRTIASALFPDAPAAFLYPTGDHEALTRLIAHEVATGERAQYLRSRLDGLRELIASRWSLRATAETLARLAHDAPTVDRAVRDDAGAGRRLATDADGNEEAVW